MLYFDKQTKKMVGCDLEVSDKIIAMQCKECAEDCRIRGLLVMEVNWNLPKAEAGMAQFRSQGAEVAAG